MRVTPVPLARFALEPEPASEASASVWLPSHRCTLSLVSASPSPSSFSSFIREDNEGPRRRTHTQRIPRLIFRFLPAPSPSSADQPNPRPVCLSMTRPQALRCAHDTDRAHTNAPSSSDASRTPIGRREDQDSPPSPAVLACLRLPPFPPSLFCRASACADAKPNTSGRAPPRPRPRISCTPARLHEAHPPGTVCALPEPFCPALNTYPGQRSGEGAGGHLRWTERGMMDPSALRVTERVRNAPLGRRALLDAMARAPKMMMLLRSV